MPKLNRLFWASGTGAIVASGVGLSRVICPESSRTLLSRQAAGPIRSRIDQTDWPELLVPWVCKDDPLWRLRDIGQWDRAIGEFRTKCNHLFTDPRQPKVRDLQDAVLCNE